ncbi:NDR1/HIN1-like protein 26 [Punica granatum]|uniref:NDR1/HIN1-like protein 26 n=1 Tax=Punica granatum TaxID=22663 RepID=A0A6P8D8E2_PUNGR|nr:NDR1/HIN1-like protein 26 [Punica granatum]
MSQAFSRSPKHCAEQQGIKNFTINNLPKKLFFAFSAFFTSVLALIFLIYIILHPAKPQFSLCQADLYKLDLTLGPAHFLNSSIQLTLQSKNPNTKVGIYYDELQAYASYKGQQITVDSPIPPFYQGHGESNTLSASLAGSELPVGPSFGYEVGKDQTAGKLVLNLKVNGRIRWKVGMWVSARYRLNVDCITVMAFGAQVLTTGPFSSNQGSRCSTSV